MTFPISPFLVLPIIALIGVGCSHSDPENSLSVSAPPLTKAVTPDQLSLQTACALAVTHHASLATYPMDRRAADARILKASRIPNPTLNLDDEDFFGTGNLGGLSASVLNSLITQVIERGGKRQARTEAARKAGAVMDAEYQLQRRQIIRETGELYFQAVAAREKARFLEAALKRSQKTADLVSDLSEAGRVTISALQQARLEVQKLELEIAAARRNSERAARALTAQWGDSRAVIVTHQRLEAPPNHLPAKSSQITGLNQHPKISLSRSKVAESDALLELARANKLGNLTIGGGIRHASASDQLSGLAALSLPLPIFNKRQDAIDEMTALAEKSRSELEGTQRALTTEFSLAWSDLRAAHETANLIKTDLLPTATALFQSAEESFRSGKITALEYLAAQQQFQEISRQWLSARLNYQTHAARVQTLTTRSL